ncbi:MAG: hypothetical protein WCJ95_04410 [Mariniphaga sp.]
MKKNKIPWIQVLSLLAITGNILFVLWVTMNGLKEHFQGTIFEKLSYIGLMGLLGMNTFLIVHFKKK